MNNADETEKKHHKNINQQNGIRTHTRIEISFNIFNLLMTFYITKLPS